MVFFNTIYTFCDAPEAFAIMPQDPATPALEGMLFFHNYLMLFLLTIGIAVVWLLYIVVKFFNSLVNKTASIFTHSNTLEIVWTVFPSIILLFLAIPSFSLLFSLDDLINPFLTLKIVGHQWYWEYQMDDSVFLDDQIIDNGLKFDSYIINSDDLALGTFRLLETDNRVVLPVLVHIRLLISSADVLHSWAVPSFGIKVDACPGRLSEASLLIKREGTFYGQCSEICGVNHGFMPIVVEGVSIDNFTNWRAAKIEDLLLFVMPSSILKKVNSKLSSAAKTIKNFKIYKTLYSHIIAYGTPFNLNWFWSFGSMAGLILVWQIITGWFLGFAYLDDPEYAFASIVYIMTDMENGYLLRYSHVNGASVFFIIVYLHMAKGLFYGSYFKPRNVVWWFGVIILILMMATAFIGYVLPWGQMSLWGATVITTLFSSIPKIGTQVCYTIWGGFTVAEPTLHRFFAIHFLLPFALIALVGSHLIFLHEAGSNNARGLDFFKSLFFFPAFGIKDLKAFIGTVVFLGVLLALHPNVFGHPDNDIPANPYATPPHIVPEWYFLPFYAILRSIPHKLGGVIAMFLSLVILLFLPFLNKSQIRNTFFRPIYAFFLFWFFIDLFFLGWIGQLSPESPYVVFGLIGTIYYFAFIVVIVPISGWYETKKLLPFYSKEVLEAIARTN